MAGLSQPVTAQGEGIGTAVLYVESEFQKAADQALSHAITSLAAALPATCK
jgi:hypothetical protein